MRYQKGQFRIVFLVLIVIYSSFSSGYAADETLRILLWQAPAPTASPFNSRANKEFEVWRPVFEPLATYDAEGRLIPILAAEIPSVENSGLSADRTWVIWKLKQGIRWADGVEFTADDLIFTYNHIFNPVSNVVKVFTTIYESVSKIEKIDDYSVKLYFKSANHAWMSPFTGRLGMIVPRHCFTPIPIGKASRMSEFKEFIGTGPYRLKKYQPQEILMIGGNVIAMNRILYEANPVFREPGKPYFSKIELRGGGDPGAAAQAVITEGTADFAFDIQEEADILAQLESGDKGRLIRVYAPDVEAITLNFTDPKWDFETNQPSSLTNPNPFFKDKRVRQAIVYAIDRNAIAALYGKAGRLTEHMLVSPLLYRSESVFYEFNPRKAAALLDDADWKDHDKDGIRDKDGIKLILRYQTTLNPLRQKIQNMVRNNLNDIGIKVYMKAVEASVFFGKLEEAFSKEMVIFFYADIQEYSAGNESPDPLSYMKWLHSSQIPQKSNNYKGHNYQRWNNPEYDALYEKAVSESDIGKRRKMIIQLNDMAIENVVLIPLVNKAFVNAVSNHLDGVEFTPWDAAVWKIKDWRLK